MIKKKDVRKMYNLPSVVKFCKKCTMSNQRPRITFDNEGVCSACRFAEFKQGKINWVKREKELIELAKRFKRKDGYYEVIVPGSGGKDSGIVAHELKYKYGMKVLTVTWAPHLYTEIGFKNFQNMMHIGGLDNILGTPDGAIHKRLTKLGFEVLGEPMLAFIYGQTNFPMQIAVKYKIPLIMYGENGEVEYGGDMKNAFRPTRDYRKDHKKHYFSGIAPEDLVDFNIQKKELLNYMAPSNRELDALGTEIHFYSYYKKWAPQNNYHYCVNNTGFLPKPVRSEGTYSKHASLDDKIDGFHFYLSYIKFGIGRATSDSAHEIRDGHLTKEKAVQLIKKYDGEFPKKHFKVFLDYCGITKEHFWKVIDSWRPPHIWKKVNGKWKLRHKIS